MSVVQKPFTLQMHNTEPFYLSHIPYTNIGWSLIKKKIVYIRETCSHAIYYLYATPFTIHVT